MPIVLQVLASTQQTYYVRSFFKIKLFEKIVSKFQLLNIRFLTGVRIYENSVFVQFILWQIVAFYVSVTLTGYVKTLKLAQKLTEITVETGRSLIKLGLMEKILASESPLKVMKNAFYFTLIALLILKIFTFLS